MRVAIIIASTEVYKGMEDDKAGRVAKQIIEEAGHDVVFLKALPLDKTVISTVMQRMADGRLADLILTTGGAGCATGDITPEATMEIVDRPVNGIPEAMRAYTLQFTKRAMLNRSAAGIRNEVLIVNLPGKANALNQCLEYILPELTHAVSLLEK